MSSAGNLVDELAKALEEDLTKVFVNLFKDSYEGPDFYIHVLSSNPKLYPISGLQHYIGAGFVAARLASFMELDEYNIAVALLGGLFHDLNKWAVGADRAVEYFRGTEIYESLEGVLGSKVEKAIEDAIAIGRSLESGGTPRTLQKVAELVRAGDHLTGGEESWSLLNDINRLLELGPVLGSPSAKNVVPVHVGKRRPIVSLLSDKVLDLLKERGLTPLLSTPEGMLLLAKDTITQDVLDDVYKKLGEQVSKGLSAGEEEQGTGTEEAKVDIRFEELADFVNDKKAMKTYSRTFGSLSKYTESSVDEAYERAVSSGDFNKRLFVLALANIYRKRIRSDESEKDRLTEFLRELGLTDLKITGHMDNDLRSLYSRLTEVNIDELAREARDFVKTKIRELRKGPAQVIGDKLPLYIAIGDSTRPVRLPNAKGTCSVCREPVAVEFRLTNYLQKLQVFIRGARVSDVFHPDKQGRPDVHDTLKDAKELPVCEVCMFEADMLSKHGAVDGLWSYVLIYYPATSIDLLMALRSAMLKALSLTELQLTVMPDYMTSRIVIPTRRMDLTYPDLQVAAALWYVFGGSLDVTTVSMSSAYVWSGLPFSVEKGEPVVEEAVNEYMNALRRAKGDPKYLKNTATLRLWLFKLLFDYSECLRGESVRPMVSVTGNPTVDAYSACVKQ